MAPASLSYQQSCRMLVTQLNYVRKNHRFLGRTLESGAPLESQVQFSTCCPAQNSFLRLKQKNHNWTVHFRHCSNLLSGLGGSRGALPGMRRINHPAVPYSSWEFRLAQIYTSWDSGPKTGRKWAISDNRWKGRTRTGLKELFRAILLLSCESCSVDLQQRSFDSCWALLVNTKMWPFLKVVLYPWSNVAKIHQRQDNQVFFFSLFFPFPLLIGHGLVCPS